MKQKKNNLIGNVLGIIIPFCVGVWLLMGTKVKYGKKIKTPYGYKQEYYLEVWGKKV